ncbi:MAG TPA: hypothetical protein VFV81_03470, partial [Verrucomicrobiae bacterium]|nr:hypothetical protein [Verrucomicrobiae bacterium]
MKTTPRLLLAMMTAVLCLSTARAQIIYSNAFNGGAVNIWGTSPTVANNFAGGTNTALWNDVLGANDTGALFQNGTETTSQGDSWLLPFSPQAGYIYALTCSVTFSNAPGSWICLGFTATDPTNLTGNARFTDSVGGIDWFIANPAAGAKEQFFYGRGAMPSAGIANQDMVNSNGTWTLQVILDTTRTISTNWTIAAFVNGVNLGSTNYTYAPTNQPITAAGIGQNVLGTPSALQWNYWTLATTLQPFIVQEPVAATLNGESTFSSKVTVMADTNGGPVSYQWYFNGVPLTNGAAVSGANTNVSSRSSLSAEVLTIASISSTNAGDYYVVVTNSYGSATSSLAGLTVLTTPVITVPATPTNAIILYAGSGGSLGSSPTFLISASGAPPLAYQWLTNGMIVGAATNSTFTFSNCQFDSPTNITCIVSNSFGEATNVWLASYIAAPTAPYPQAVLAAQPLGF